METANINNIIGAIPADIHTHSTLSPDGHGSPEAMAEQAYNLGIKHYALTDHIEADELYDTSEWNYFEALGRFHGVYQQLRSQYEGRMNIYYGVELGQALYDREQSEKILAEHDYDFVLGSCHRSRTYRRINRLPEGENVIGTFLTEYYNEMLELVEWGRFNVLTHLTFPLRFLCHDIDISRLDMSPYMSTIDKIMDTIISKGIALEVNSSGIRKGLNVPMPSAEYIRRYHNKGGRLITVGSDAHWVNDVGANIPECLAMLRDIGYNEICVFSRKNPTFIKI